VSPNDLAISAVQKAGKGLNWCGRLPSKRNTEQATPSGTPRARPALPVPPLPFAAAAAQGASSPRPPRDVAAPRRSTARQAEGQLFQMQGPRGGAPWNGLKGGRIAPHEMGHGEGRKMGCQHMGCGSWEIYYWKGVRTCKACLLTFRERLSPIRSPPWELVPMSTGVFGETDDW
jgi:hypothetical protein